ncbi:MAG TPA: rRNA maturation RNase YbeY [Candidatus Krumholzibacteria bacterium]|nr:rRNA maturation RNase YbeY [Candidatus Krumholzibacteria bacterium]HRX51119.1 rRNA maturation RNase YbeY [Candidatus Krumholzibacteria bacterium]
MILTRVRRGAAPEWSEVLQADQDRLAAAVGRAGWRVELVTVDDAEMRRLNGAYRGKDAVTDVLSFSDLLEEGTGAPDLARDEAGAWCDLWLDPLDGDEPSAGQIVMAPGFIAERCAERGWHPEDEVAMLTAHGLLHLLGWDHEDAGQRLAMRARETELLETCGRRHPMRDEEDA